MIQNNLGNFYKNLGENDKAEKLYSDSLEIRQKLARENPAYLGDLAMIQNNLGNFYSDLGENDKAEKLLEASWQTYRQLSQKNRKYIENELRAWLHWSTAAAKTGAWEEIVATVDRYYEMVDYLAIDERVLEYLWIKKHAPLPPDPESLLPRIPYPTIRQRFEETLNYIAERYNDLHENL
jgi:tetratricopeptide (TPR) repeat protein